MNVITALLSMFSDSLNANVSNIVHNYIEKEKTI